jgi:hypothetical protein
MKNRALSAIAFATLMASGAFAQTVVIAPEQEKVIKEYVTTHAVAPATVTGVEIEVGATLPDTVELHKLDVPDVKYSYVMVEGRTVLVEPETRKIVHIIN